MSEDKLTKKEKWRIVYVIAYVVIIFIMVMFALISPDIIPDVVNMMEKLRDAFSLFV